MTGQPHDDDAEFDAFLQGKGPLAQGLAQLPQPEPSAALDAVILARVALDLERGSSAAAAAGATRTRAGACAGAGDIAPDAVVAPAVAGMAGLAPPAQGGAANDEAGPADFQPRRWRERWRLPVALAAGVTAFSIALPLWQEDTAQQQAVNMPSQELQIPAVPEVAPAPAHAADAPAKDLATHAGLKAGAVRRDDAMAKRKVDSDDAARKIAEREPMVAPPMRAQQSAPLMEVAPARVKAPPAAAPPAPAPVLRLAEEEAHQPAAMLARIEQLLRDGKREEARAEWRRLRAAYPDYPVPDTLREALK